MNDDHQIPQPDVGGVESPKSDLDDPRVFDAAQEFLGAIEAGRRPSRDAFLARYPDIAPALAKCLESLEFLHHDVPSPPPLPEERLGPEADAALSLGDFRLLHEIGRGGMGVVYEAVQLSLGRRVAVKVLPFAAALDTHRLQRFRNEAQAAAQLRHPNIVPVYAVGVERGVHFYAMQLIEGAPLGELIRYLRHLPDNSQARKAPPPERESPLDRPPPATSTASHLPPSVSSSAVHSVATSTGLVALDATHCNHFRRAAILIQQAGRALDHAHQFGVIHRDIKPANLLIDGCGNLWVTDFGLAHVQTDVTLTRTGDLLGTARYMSPEQTSGDRVGIDHRTDIYSLGVTLYEFLTLEPIFAENDHAALVRRILEDDPRPPRSINRNIPNELETIVLKAIAKAPGDRYATAGQFADDLQRWLDDRPIVARRPSIWEHAARWRRRHRALMRSAAAFSLLAVLGLLAGAVAVLREHTKTKAAYQLETEHRALAEESFRQARRAVDTFTQMSEEELAGNPRMQSLRRRFLETALQYYRDFVDQRRDDPTVRAELTASSDRVTRLIDELAAIEGFGRLLLLADTRVRQDLATTSNQEEKLDALLAQLEKDRKPAQEAEDTPTPVVRQRQMGKILLSYEKQVQSLLNPTQVERLKQITRQQQTPSVFLTAEIVALLSLTPGQRNRIDLIIAAEGRGGRKHPADSRLSLPARSGDGSRQAIRDVEDRATSRILEMLTVEQRAKWSELVGRPFAYDLHRGPEQWIAH
jgi:hypothetical protein